jgi:lipoprotein signal peptidase
MFNLPKKHNYHWLIAFLGATVIILADQITKFIFAGQINHGISFSLFSRAGQLDLALVLVFIALVIFGSQQIIHHKQDEFSVLWGVLLGAGFSNLVDRWMFGGVRDFWLLPILNVQNNLADWFIFLAALGIIFLETKDQV